MSKSYYDTKIHELENDDIFDIHTQTYLTSSGIFELKSTIEKKKDNIFKRFFNLFKHKTKPVEPKEQPIPNIEHELNNVKVFTSYCGADAVIMAGNEVIGSLQDLSWYYPSELERAYIARSDYYDKDLAGIKPVVVIAKKAIFPNLKDEEKAFDGNVDIVVTYANEYGQSHYFSIYDAQVLHTVGGISVDSVMIYDKLFLCATKVTKIKPSVMCKG